MPWSLHCIYHYQLPQIWVRLGKIRADRKYWMSKELTQNPHTSGIVITALQMGT